MLLKEIGYRVRMARLAKHMSQANLAEELHVSSPYISNIEQGKQAMSIVTLCGICEVLEVSADWILCRRMPEAGRKQNELEEILSDCTPAERSAMLRLLKDMKDMLRSS